MPERTLLRVGGVSGIVGAVLSIVFNILHPRAAQVEEITAQLRVVAESAGFYVLDHWVLSVAVFLFVGFYAALYRSITQGPAAAWAWFGFAVSIVAVSVSLVALPIDNIAVKTVAVEWAKAPAADAPLALRIAEAVLAINLGLFSVVFTLLFGVTPLLFGIAIASSDGYPRWLGWVAIVLGALLIVFVGVPFAASAPAFPATVIFRIVFPLLSTLATLWILIVGVQMLRRAGQVA